MGFEERSVKCEKAWGFISEAKEALTCGVIVVLKEDNDHDEERYVFLGMCKKLNVLVVVVAYPDETIKRIISARKPTKKERLFYEIEL